MKSTSTGSVKERLHIEKQRAAKRNLTLMRQKKATKISSRHTLFWNGVDGLMQIHKNSNFANGQKKTDNMEMRISMTNHKKVAEYNLISPSGSRKVAWDLLTGVAIFYSIIEVPFRIGFRSMPSQELIILNSVVQGIFFCDIILTFNTAFVDPVTDLLVTDRWLIVRGYGSFWLWIDLASTIPFDQIILAAVSGNSAAPNVSTLRLIRVLRLVRLTKLIKLVGSKSLKDVLDKYLISPAFISIVTLLLQIFVVAHIVCCFWFFITTSDAGFADDAEIANITWVTTFGFKGSDVQTQYIASLYWAFATMLTVGYGDIHATNTVERFYAFLTMLLGSLMFGAIIAKVRVLVESRNLQLKELKIRVAEFKAYLEERRIPFALKAEAKEAYLYYLQRRPSLVEGGLFDGLPREMLYKLIRSAFHREIQAVDLFRQCDIPFLSQLIVHVRPYHAQCGDVIYEMGDIAGEITFITRGSVGISVFGLGGVGGKGDDAVHQKTEAGTAGRDEDKMADSKKDLRTPLGYSTAGGYFGDLEYIKQSTRLARYHALDNCTLLAISFDKIREAVERNPVPGKKFMEELKKRYDDFEAVSRECFTSSTSTARRSQSAADPFSPSSPPSSPLPLLFPTISRARNARGSPTYENKSSGDLADAAKCAAAAEPHAPFISKRRSMIENLTNSVFETLEHLNHQNDSYSVLKKPESFWLNTVKERDLWVDGCRQAPEGGSKHITPDTCQGRRSAIRYIMVTQNESGKEVTTERTIQSLAPIFIFHPKDNMKIIWDVFIGLLIVYSVLTVPIQIAFFASTTGSSGHSVVTFEYVVDFFFFVDTICNFNTAYFSEADDAYIAVRRRIIFTYLQSYFIMDLVSCIPFDILVELFVNTSSADLRTLQLIRIARLLRLVKLVKILNFVKLFYNIEDMFNISPAFLSLCTTLTQVIFIAHLISCMWWGLCTNLSVVTWYDEIDMVYIPLRDAPFRDQYVASLYWTITTLATVGYGDIVPVGNEERVLTIFIMVIGATVFGYVVANVGTIVGNYNQLQARADDRLTQMIEFMKERNCPNVVVKEITNHFKQVFKHNSSFDEEAILSRLPTRLRIDLSLVQHTAILEKIILFRYIRNMSLKLFLLNTMTSHFAGADKCLLKEGDKANEIIFLVDGKCMICKIMTPTPSPLPAANRSDKSTRPVKSKREMEDSKGNDFATHTPQLWSMNIKKKPTPSSTKYDVSNKVISSRPFDVTSYNDSSGHGSHSRRTNQIGNIQSRRGSFKADPPSVSVSHHSFAQMMRNVSTKMSLRLSKLSRTRSSKPRRASNLTYEQSSRATKNWMKVKKMLPKLAAIQRSREEEQIYGFDMADGTRKIEKLNVLMDVSGHMERVACDVRPLGTLKTGGFVGHAAMMQARTYASSLVVTEPCHYYTLHKNDVQNLVRDHPGIALELQSALSLAICEVNKKDEVERKKKITKWFLDDVRERFRSRENALMVKQKQPFSKLILSLALTAKAREKEAKENEEREKKEKERREKEVSEKAKTEIFHIEEQMKAHEKEREENGVGIIKAAIRRGSQGISSTLRSGRLAAVAAVEAFETNMGATLVIGTKPKNLNIFKIESNSQVVKDSQSTFWQGMMDLDPKARSAKLLLAEKLSKLDKMQTAYLQCVEEYGSEGEDEMDLGSSGTSIRTGYPRRTSTSNGGLDLSASSSDLGCVGAPKGSRSRSITMYYQRRRSLSTLTVQKTLDDSPAVVSSDINSAAAEFPPSFVNPEKLDDEMKRSNTGCTTPAKSGYTQETVTVRSPMMQKIGDEVIRRHFFSDDISSCIDSTDVQTNDDSDGNAIASIRIGNNLNNIESLKNEDNNTFSGNNENPREIVDPNSSVGTNPNLIPSSALKGPPTPVSSDKKAEKNTAKSGKDGNVPSIMTGGSARVSSKITGSSSMSPSRSRMTRHSTSFYVPASRDSNPKSISLPTILSFHQSTKNIICSQTFKKFRGKKKRKVMKKHRSFSDLQDIKSNSNHATLGFNPSSFLGVHFKSGTYVTTEHGSFFAPQNPHIMMRRRKSFPSKESELWANQITKKQTI